MRGKEYFLSLSLSLSLSVFLSLSLWFGNVGFGELAVECVNVVAETRQLSITEERERERGNNKEDV